jgi:hypothetical protein
MDFLIHLLVAVGLQFLSVALDMLPPPQPAIPPPIERVERLDPPAPECPDRPADRPADQPCSEDAALNLP